jgi:hypothetical protein
LLVNEDCNPPDRSKHHWLKNNHRVTARPAEAASAQSRCPFWHRLSNFSAPTATGATGPRRSDPRMLKSPMTESKPGAF